MNEKKKKKEKRMLKLLSLLRFGLVWCLLNFKNNNYKKILIIENRRKDFFYLKKRGNELKNEINEIGLKNQSKFVLFSFDFLQIHLNSFSNHFPLIIIIFSQFTFQCIKRIQIFSLFFVFL